MPTTRTATRAPLWLAVQCPHLALDLITRGGPPTTGEAVAVSDADARRPRILDCNPAALKAGIQPGLRVSAALGLLDTLRLHHRDHLAEQATLERLAARCYQYSSQVSLPSGHDTLLLEIGASRRLFGDAAELSSRLARDLQQLGYQVRTGTAPTPEAARLAARHGLQLQHTASIGQQIARLPLDSLLLEPAQLAALGKMGFRRIGEALRLPRKALGRRLGPATVDYLDRLTGARPDPRRTWHPPEHFSAGLDLAAPTCSSQALLFPLRRLVTELCGILRARDRGIQQLGIALHHGQGVESLQLGLQRPTRDEERFMLLLRERLERLELPRPAHHVRLSADRLLELDTRQETLFRTEANGGTDTIFPLLERLRARLGEHAVTGLGGHPDHRPEYSWARRELQEPAACDAMPHRPVWLFAQPQRCDIAGYQLLAGPERIETGWWDGRDCRRDYFVVRDAAGRTLWAFREYKPGSGWYLQGMFS